MRSLTTGSIREILDGGIMTAGDIAKAGNWDFDDVCYFFCRHAMCEVKIKGFERHMIAGRGVGYKWIDYTNKEKRKRCTPFWQDRERIVIDHIAKRKESAVSFELSHYGWEVFHLAQTLKRLKKLGLIEPNGKRKNRSAIYMMTEKGREYAAKN